MADSLIAGRSRRSNAGKRMRALLDEQRALLEDESDHPRKKQKRNDEDAEQDAIFQEDEHDGEFQAPTNWAEEADHFDSDFADSESDREAEDEGEKEIERADVERKRAARRAARIAPSIPTRKPKPSSATSSRPTQPANALQTLSSSSRRVSSRKSTVQSAIQIRSKLQEAQEAAKQRHEQEEARPQLPAPPTLNQAELIELALQREEENRHSLREWLLGEEERKKNELKREKRERPVQFLRWRSVGVRQRLVVEVAREEKQDASRLPTAGDASGPQTADTPSVQQAAAEGAQDVSRDEGDAGDQTAAEASVSVQEENRTGGAATADISMDDVTEQAQDHTDIADAPQSSAEHGAQDISTPPPPESQTQTDQPAEQPPTGALASAQSDGLSTPPLPPTTATNLPFSPPSRPLDITLDPVLAARKEAAALADGQQSKPHEQQETATGPLESRTFISLHDLTRTDLPPKHEQWSTLFGTHTDWSKVWILSGDHVGRTPQPRPEHPRASLCAITGKLARYRDAKTGIPFADVHAARVIRSFWSQRQQRRGVPSVSVDPNPPHDYEWVEIDLGSEADVRRAAGASGSSYRKKGGKKSRKSGVDETAGDAPNESPAISVNEPHIKTGYWAPIQHRPQNDIVIASTPTAATAAKRGRGRPSAATRGAVASSSSTTTTMPTPIHDSMPDELKYMGVAPGDEKALMAQAMALPTGSTRSGRKRGAGG